ncbi:YesL family protein [Salana multivorans]
MNKLLHWHTWIGDTGRRYVYLQLLWLAHALLGAVVVGVFPATAALTAVLRRDRMAADGWAHSADRPRLPIEFHQVWRRELVAANGLGYLLAALWAFVLLDHRMLRTVEIPLAPVLQGLLWLLTAALVCVTATVWVLQAHFAEGPLRLLRRAGVLLVGRPLLSLACAATTVATACPYYLLPGLVVVFGVVVPTAVAVGLVWRSGVLPRPDGTSTAVPLPVAPGAASTLA